MCDPCTGSCDFSLSRVLTFPFGSVQTLSGVRGSTRLSGIRTHRQALIRIPVNYLASLCGLLWCLCTHARTHTHTRAQTRTHTRTRGHTKSRQLGRMVECLTVQCIHRCTHFGQRIFETERKQPCRLSHGYFMRYLKFSYCLEMFHKTLLF